MKAVIIYVSSNKEMPEFEQRIQNSLIENCGEIPIISVTQKPVSIGTNIVVGSDIGVSGFNMFRQVLIGLKASDADYVFTCEADTVYSPEHFAFVPERLDVCYRNNSMYLMGQHRNYFYRKREGSTCTQVVGRKFYIDTLENLFKDAPQWSSTEKNFPKERTGKNDVFEHITFFSTEHPVAQIKTSQSMRHYNHSERIPIYEIPYWGKGSDFRNKFYNIGFIH